MQAKWTVRTVLMLLLVGLNGLWTGCSNETSQQGRKSGSSGVRQTTGASGGGSGEGTASWQSSGTGATGTEAGDGTDSQRSEALTSNGGYGGTSQGSDPAEGASGSGSSEAQVSQWRLTFVLDSLEVTSGDDCDLGVFEKTEQVTRDLTEKVSDGAGDVTDWLGDKIFGLTDFGFDFPVPDPSSVTSQDLGDFVICVEATHGDREYTVYCPDKEHALNSTHMKIGEKKTITVPAGDTVEVSVNVYDQDLVSKEKLISENLTIYTPRKKSDPEAKNQTMASVGQYETCKATLHYGISWEPASG